MRFDNRFFLIFYEAIISSNLEPTTGLEPVNLFLTKEVLYQLSYVGLFAYRPWSGKRDSNPRPSAWKADALAS
jgi:hypothetical protein